MRPAAVASQALAGPAPQRPYIIRSARTQKACKVNAFFRNAKTSNAYPRNRPCKRAYRPVLCPASRA